MYKGQIAEIPCGVGGLNGSLNTYLIPPTNLIRANNVRFDNKTIRKAGGLSLFDANALAGAPKCYGGIDWRPTVGTQNQVTVWDNGKVHKESGNDIDATTLVSGLTIANPVVFVEGGNISAGNDKELYLYCKGVPPKKLVGTAGSMVGITSESPDWSANKPGAAIYHDYRVLVFDVDGAPHNFYISSLADHSAFNPATADDSRVFTIAPGVGDRLAAAISYLPQLVYFFKYPRGIWAVDTTDLTGFYLPTTLIRDDVGIAGPNCVAKVGSDVLFVSPNGRLYSLQALRPDVDPIEADITAKLELDRFILDFVDATKLKFARLVYDEARKELFYYCTQTGSATTNNIALIFDFSDYAASETIKVSIENRGEFFQAAWKRIASSGFNEMLVAGAGGKVYRTNSVNRSVNGAGYTSEFQTPDDDFRAVNPQLAGLDKVYLMLEIAVIPTGSYTMSFDVIVDGTLRKTISAAVGSDEALWNGGGNLGSDPLEVMFAGQTVVKHRFPIDVVGNQISIRGVNASANEDFGIIYLRHYFKPQNMVYEA